VRERVFELKLTVEGTPILWHMLVTMSWKYVFFYLRLKVQVPRPHHRRRPGAARSDYVRVANEFVDNMTEVRAFANLNNLRFPIADDAISDFFFAPTLHFS
jgi:hypothetical protein